MLILSSSQNLHSHHQLNIDHILMVIDKIQLICTDRKAWCHEKPSTADVAVRMTAILHYKGLVVWHAHCLHPIVVDAKDCLAWMWLFGKAALLELLKQA